MVFVIVIEMVIAIAILSESIEMKITNHTCALEGRHRHEQALD